MSVAREILKTQLEHWKFLPVVAVSDPDIKSFELEVEVDRGYLPGRMFFSLYIPKDADKAPIDFADFEKGQLTLYRAEPLELKQFIAESGQLVFTTFDVGKEKTRIVGRLNAIFPGDGENYEVSLDFTIENLDDDDGSLPCKYKLPSGVHGSNREMRRSISLYRGAWAAMRLSVAHAKKKEKKR